MRDPARIRPTLDAIAEIWARHPDIRLGQLLAHASGNRDIFQIEDDALLRGLAELDRTTKSVKGAER